MFYLYFVLKIMAEMMQESALILDYLEEGL